MSKIPKGRAGLDMTKRLRLKRQDLTLPKLFDMIALISFLGAVAFAGATYFMNEKLDALTPTAPRYGFWLTWIRAAFALMMYCLFTFATSYGMGRFMKDQEYEQVKRFRQWFAAEIVVAVLLVFNLAVFF
ncbi:MAG: hypothetical protein Q6373_002015 [Candidatus Sigynarchaeota archaeon]